MSAVKSNPISLINQLFEWNLEQDRHKKTEDLQELVPALLSMKKYYIIAASNTTQTDWENKEFAVFVNEKQDLLVFIDGIDAERFAKQHNLMSPVDQSPMIKCISYNALTKLAMAYSEMHLIKRLKIYARRPLFLYCPLSYIQANMEQTHVDLMHAKLESEDPIVYPDREFKMVEDVKTVLDMPEVSKRRSIDPGLICENLHAVIEKLIFFNKLDMAKMEQELQLPPGWIKHFCLDRVSTSISKQSAIKLLKYFGLQEYLYQYKRYCNELMRELNENDTIDRYEIKPVNLKTSEKFKLINMRRGQDAANHAYVYELTLKSKTREIQLTVSTPLNYIIGKAYEIVGLDQTDDMDDEPPHIKQNKEKQTDSSVTDEEKSKIPKNRVIPRCMESVELSQSSRNKNEKHERSQEDQDFDTIIGFFKEQYQDNFQAAENRFSVLAPHSDIVKTFARYIRSKRTGSLRIQDISAGELMQEYRYDPYEAFSMMVELRENAAEAKQKLRLRKGELKAEKQRKEAEKAQNS